MFGKYFFRKFLSFFVIVSMFFGVTSNYVMAASVTSFSVLLTREKAATLTNMTVTFTLPAGIDADETIILTFNNSTSIPVGLDFTDIDMKDDAVELTLAAAPAASTWGVVRTSSTVLTFTNGDTPIGNTSVIEIQIGTHATAGTTGDQQITNGSVGITTLTLSGTMGNPDITGIASMPIIDDDQVTVTATVNQTMTFDLDTSVADGETATPYSVALGTITTTDTRVSGSTDSINMIIAELDTNATGGAVVTVRNANGSNGLVSTSVPADNIGSADGAMVDGTENYGLCVISVTQTTGTLAKASPYNAGTCATNSETNDIQALTTTGENILNTTSAPIAGAHAEISVNAAISGVTVAHSDYTDTLTFIATGTF
ncbi:MAG: hypothetical protein AAB438_01580 [Patescibacteria group bacterium]